MAIIEANHLVKEYKRKNLGDGMKGALYHMFHPEYEMLKAVNDISFTVDEGEAVGYIGPNGSGKSTTIKMLTGILTPTSGTIKVNGRIPTKERIKNNRDIGVVTGNRSLLFFGMCRLLSRSNYLKKCTRFRMSFTKIIWRSLQNFSDWLRF